MAAAYRELVVKGDEDVMRGFLVCYRIEHNIKSGVIMADRHPINTHHLREILTFRGHRVHIIAKIERYKRFIPTLRKAASELGFEIVSDRAVRRAWFEFEFETFNRQVAGQIKRFFSTLPEGVRQAGSGPEEIVDPSAKGVEVYTPAHEYIYRCKGELEGDLEALLLAHEKLQGHEFIEIKNINIKHV